MLGFTSSHYERRNVQMAWFLARSGDHNTFRASQIAGSMGIPLSGKDLPLISALLGPSDSSINISIAHHLAGVVWMNGSSICKWALLAGTVPRSVAAAWEST